MILAIAASVLNLSGTVITLQPSTEPGAIAEVVMSNELVNGDLHEGTYPLDLNGLKIGVTFDWQHEGTQDDAITVTPPDGVICQPRSCVLVVPETGEGTLYLLEWIGG